MSGGGKGGKKTEETTIPEWLRGPAARNLQRAEAVQQIEYMPYYGPDVAAFTPAQNAAFDTNIGAAEAFGLLAPNTLTATSGMPTPTDWDGFTGYSSQPIYESALAELNAKQPGAVAQYNALFGNATPAINWGGGGGGGGSRFRGNAPGSPSSNYGDVPITGRSLKDIVLRDAQGNPMSNPIADTTISWNPLTRDARGNLPSVPLSTPSFNLKPPSPTMYSNPTLGQQQALRNMKPVSTASQGFPWDRNNTGKY